jgi:hypothetical protein
VSISKELFLSILAMDSYNRGYGAGLGSDTDGLGSIAGTKIGNATILDNDLPTGSQAVGFYAISYKVGSGVDGLASGTTVISYRGTNADSAANFLSDSWNGYGTAFGNPNNGHGLTEGSSLPSMPLVRLHQATGQVG